MAHSLNTSALQKVSLYAGRFLSAVSVLFLAGVLIKNFTSVPPIRLNLSSISSLIVVWLFISFCGLCGFYAWTLLLRGGNVFIDLKDACIIVGKSQIRKYLPGNVFHYVGRVTIGGAHGISKEALILSMGVETIIAAGTAGLLTIIGTIYFHTSNEFFQSYLTSGRSQVLAWSLVGMALLLAMALAFSAKVREWMISRRAYLSYRRVIAAMGLFSLFNLLIGIGIVWVLESMWGIDPMAPWYFYSWGFTAAWVLGFVIPGASGGIGIREAVLVSLFGPLIGAGLAAGLAVVLRVLTSLSDLGLFLLATSLENRLAKTGN